MVEEERGQGSDYYGKGSDYYGDASDYFGHGSDYYGNTASHNGYNYESNGNYDNYGIANPYDSSAYEFTVDRSVFILNPFSV